ncbi:hypothetical protein BH10PSE4_BH10PSE4_07230 [soil metagenome]
MANISSPRMTRAPVALGAPVQDVLTLAFSLILSLVLIMGIVEFSSAWFWPQNGIDYFFTIERIGGGPFRTALWMFIALGFVGTILRGPNTPLLISFLPLAAFWFIALLSSAFGDNPVSSIWFLTLWSVMACAALAIGSQMSGGQIGAVAAVAIGLVALLSLALYPIHPQWVTMQGGGKTLLRGLFMHKNACGWFGAIGFLFLFSYTTGANLFRYGVLALCVAMVLLSQSGTAFGVLIIGVAFLFVLRQLQTSGANPFFKVLVIVLILVALGVTINFILPAITEALEKGQSLRNREAGWNLYLRFFEGHMVLGRGPGAFVTGTSVINRMISETFVNDLNMSVHNSYLALLGEVGVLGLSAYIGGYLYIIVIASTRSQASRGDITAAILALGVLCSGFTEARDTLVPHIATFLMLVARSSAVAQRYNALRRSRQAKGRQTAPVALAAAA